MKPLIYLASPFTHEDPAVEVMRFVAASRAAAMLKAKGEHVISPIAHGCPLWLFGDDDGSDFKGWRDLSFALLDRCNETFVLKLTGWELSDGVTAEIERSRHRCMPIRYMEPVETSIDRAVVDAGAAAEMFFSTRCTRGAD